MLFSILLAGALLIAGVGYFIRRTPLPDGLHKPPPGTPVIVDFRGRSLAVLATPFARGKLSRDACGTWESGFRWPLLGSRMRAFGAIQVLTFARRPGRFSAIFKVDALFQAPPRSPNSSSKCSQKIRRERFRAKIREALAALRLEREWQKSKILEAYLNRLDYGNQRIGPAAAARAYFGKPARELSLAEAIFLAGLPQSPTRLNPWKNPDAALERYRRNVSRLAK